MALPARPGQAKEHALTGRPLTGREAADVELINRAVPFAELEATVAALAAELAAIPLSQLAAMKLVVNQAYENMGLASTQTLGPDPRRAHAQHARRRSASSSGRRGEGVGAAVAERDGPFGDYSQAPPERRPDPDNVITPDHRRRRVSSGSPPAFAASSREPLRRTRRESRCRRS